jgi:hypothetical protein
VYSLDDGLTERTRLYDYTRRTLPQISDKVVLNDARFELADGAFPASDPLNFDGHFSPSDVAEALVATDAPKAI